MKKQVKISKKKKKIIKTCLRLHGSSRARNP